VRVGDQTYPGFPGAGVGIKGGDSVRVAFFALLHDQDVNAPIAVYARDAAGNEMATPLDHRVFPKPFAHGRIEISDEFLQRVVPAIAATTPDMKLATAPQDLIVSFLRINGELRRRNNQTIAEQAKKTKPEMLWKDAFQPLGNAAVEAKFADSRTYFYQGREVDRQVHLGFDLAVTAHVPVLAANRGIVLYAADLGIYGNCLIVDHGLGVQSLYAHLSSIDVKVGDTVEKGQTMAHSGMTGLAAGDHLHFTMLVNGAGESRGMVGSQMDERSGAPQDRVVVTDADQGERRVTPDPELVAIVTGVVSTRSARTIYRRGAWPT
jgi:murein DD-endopeptidase MepM/ murein hydrolase activator NlpD